MNQTGVLVDSFEDGYQLGLLQWPDLTRDEYRAMFDQNIFDSLRDRGPMHCTDNELAQFKKDYMIPNRMKLPLQKGMKEFFESISGTAQFAINSSGNSNVNRLWLEQQGIDIYFPIIMGKSEGLSKSEKFSEILNLFSANPENAIYITDKSGDAREAISAGLRVILITWGFQTRIQLEVLQNEPQILGIVNTPIELEALVRSVFRLN